MIKRTCPNCGEVRYSADTATDWVCEKCGALIKKELSKPA